MWFGLILGIVIGYVFRNTISGVVGRGRRYVRRERDYY